MKLCWIVLFGICAFAASGVRADQDPDTTGGRLEVEIEALPETPYEQEMVLLTIRGFYPYTIALSELKQPAFRNFGWMQLGRDRWFEVQGQQMRGFERIMAIFPQRAGRLTIDPFVHHLTLVTSDGQRLPHNVASEPTAIDVRPKPTTSGWWFPARGARFADGWDVPPDQLAPGQAAVRTVTLEADGIGPELLPPIPSMRSPNLIVFADPGERTTTLTPKGPVSRVVWRWTVKPAISAITELEAITIPWFDTAVRQNREIVLAPQRIALAGSTPDLSRRDDTYRNFIAFVPPAGLFFGFLAGLALLLPGMRLRSRQELARIFRRLMPERDAWALRFAAWSGNAARVRSISNRLIRRDSEESRHAPLGADVQAGLRSLDACLYGPADMPKPPINLRTFARRFLRARR